MKKLALGISAAALVCAGAAVAADRSDRGHGMDADGNGVTTRTEVQASAAKMFAMMDANKDGRIDESDRTLRQTQRRDEMFARLDTDGNGAISKAEFNAMSAMHGKRGDHGGDAEGKGHRMGKRGGPGKMMDMADANKDGAITQAEFTAGALTRFEQMDTDNDGQVTAAEQKAARDAMRAKWREARKAQS